MQQQFSLAGKKALVTGAGRGLGRAMALALADAGADVAVAARTQSQLEATARHVGEFGGRCLAVTADVTDSESVGRMVAKVDVEFGGIDILVNNAGGIMAAGGFAPELPEITDATWRAGIEANLSGAVYCSRAIIPQMIRRGGGKIINITSVAGLSPGGNCVYNSAKAALINFTRSVALTYAPVIEANLIAPGIFPHGTPAVAAMFDQDNVPLGRLGDDEEVGPVCVFLASPASGYMNGQIIVLDGGGLAGGHAPTGFAPVVQLEGER